MWWKRADEDDRQGWGERAESSSRLPPPSSFLPMSQVFLAPSPFLRSIATSLALAASCVSSPRIAPAWTLSIHILHFLRLARPCGLVGIVSASSSRPFATSVVAMNAPPNNQHALILPSTANKTKKKARKTIAHLKEICSAVAQGKVNLGLPLAIQSTTATELSAILGGVVVKTKTKTESFEQKVATLGGVASLKTEVIAYREEIAAAIAARQLPANPALWTLAQIKGAWETMTPQERTLTTRFSMLDAEAPILNLIVGLGPDGVLAVKQDAEALLRGTQSSPPSPTGPVRRNRSHQEGEERP